MPWQTKDYYASERKILEDSEFDRIHRNNWQRPVSAYINELVWKACHDSEIERFDAAPLHFQCTKCDTRAGFEHYRDRVWQCDNCGGDLAIEKSSAIPDKTPVVLSIDAATEGDCSAIAAVTRHPDPLKAAREVVVRACRVYYPPVNLTRSLEYSVREWVAQWNTVVVAYDPYQMRKMAQDMGAEGEGLVWFNAFSQGDRRAIADKKLLDMIMARQVTYNGGVDEMGIPVCEGITELTKHMIQAGKKKSGESRLRIVKQAKKPNDAAVALSMAVDECLRLVLA
jgi:ribosomal protein L37AE/L43A